MRDAWGSPSLRADRGGGWWGGGMAVTFGPGGYGPDTSGYRALTAEGEAHEVRHREFAVGARQLGHPRARREDRNAGRPRAARRAPRRRSAPDGPEVQSAVAAARAALLRLQGCSARAASPPCRPRRGSCSPTSQQLARQRVDPHGAGDVCARGQAQARPRRRFRSASEAPCCGTGRAPRQRRSIRRLGTGVDVPGHLEEEPPLEAPLRRQAAVAAEVASRARRCAGRSARPAPRAVEVVRCRAPCCDRSGTRRRRTRQA